MPGRSVAGISQPLSFAPTSVTSTVGEPKPATTAAIPAQSGFVRDTSRQAVPTTGPHFGRRKSIVILDSNVHRAEERASRLRLAGIEVRCAATPEHALECLEERISDLLLIEARKEPAAALHFSASAKRFNPAQRIGFYVDGPECISWAAPGTMPGKNTTRVRDADKKPLSLEAT